jgi:hypothetical protein
LLPNVFGALVYGGAEYPVNRIGGVSLHIRHAAAAAEPAVLSETVLPSDTDLIDAHQAIEELDRKISATLKQHGDDANEHPGYLKLEDERYEAIDLLSSKPAHSVRALCAKASTLKMREVLEDYVRTTALAESLADDVLRLSGVA